MAVQLAKRMGARVLAVASGQDGVALAKRLRADKVIDGYSEDIVAAAREFAPKGIDAVLLTAGKARQIYGKVLESIVLYPTVVLYY